MAGGTSGCVARAASFSLPQPASPRPVTIASLTDRPTASTQPIAPTRPPAHIRTSRGQVRHPAPLAPGCRAARSTTFFERAAAGVFTRRPRSSPSQRFFVRAPHFGCGGHWRSIEQARARGPRGCSASARLVWDVLRGCEDGVLGVVLFPAVSTPSAAGLSRGCGASTWRLEESCAAAAVLRMDRPTLVRPLTDSSPTFAKCGNILPFLAKFAPTAPTPGELWPNLVQLAPGSAESGQRRLKSSQARSIPDPTRSNLIEVGPASTKLGATARNRPLFARIRQTLAIFGPTLGNRGRIRPNSGRIRAKSARAMRRNASVAWFLKAPLARDPAPSRRSFG